MGRKKFDVCSKCDFQHGAQMAKGCSAGDSEQLGEQIDDKNLQREQDPKCVGLDVHGGPSGSQKAVSVIERVDKIERDMDAMDGKLDLLIPNMGKQAHLNLRQMKRWKNGAKTLRRPGMRRNPVVDPSTKR